MTDKICRNCKHWCGHIFADGKTLDGPCTLLDKDGNSTMIHIDIDTKYPEFVGKIIFYTKAEFGCNQWKEDKL